MKAAVAVGIGLRLVALLWYLAGHGWRGETWEYEEIAQSLLRGDGYIYFHHGVPLRSAYMPVFPLVCALLHWVGGVGLWAFYTFHLVCAAALIWSVHALASEVWSSRVARWAAWLVACEPALVIYQSYKVDAVPLASLLLVLALLALARHARGGALRDAACSGAMAAVATLTRPDMIVYWLAPVVWAVRNRFSVATRRGLLTAVVAFAGIFTPWIARNIAVHGRLMPATTLSGVNLWIGNNPNSTGTPWARSGVTQWQAAPREFRAAIMSGPELASDDHYRREAMAYIRAHPLETLCRWARTFAYFWWFAPDLSERLYYSWAPAVAWAGYKLVYSLVLILIALGTWAGVRDRVAYVGWFWACSIGLAALHSSHFVEGRHRLLVLPLLLIVAAKGLDEIRTRGLDSRLTGGLARCRAFRTT